MNCPRKGFYGENASEDSKGFVLNNLVIKLQNQWGVGLLKTIPSIEANYISSSGEKLIIELATALLQNERIPKDS
ncbi:unnamed protein product [Ilex paraguariensis]|uniref:Uncharacterized protein n=1 Tax=Ilex paraguariensis TaxID=185542 RepID=A0ABC8T184_9AQUA